MKAAVTSLKLKFSEQTSVMCTEEKRGVCIFPFEFKWVISSSVDTT